jgi:anti-anti-sigma regulatory factor
MSANLIIDHPTRAITVARFARPDVREALYHHGHEHDDIGDSILYRELHDGALAGLPSGGVLILNFGLVDAFSSAFYRLLLKARTDLKAKDGRLLLCGLSKFAHEAFSLMGGPKTFEVFSSESDAITAATK